MQTLKPCPFCGSEARMWPSHTKADSNGSYEIIGCSNVECHIEPTTAEYLPYEEAVKRWNTRPGAPVDGLETAWGTPRELLAAFGANDIREGSRAVLGDGIEEDEWEDYLEVPVHIFEKMLAKLVTRSQAVAIIAAERQQKEVALADRKMLLDLASSNGEKVSTLEADNAALTARVKELEDKRIEDRFTVVDEMEKREALETQVAAAKERETKAFKAGYVLACCNVVHQHDEPTIAHDALAELGVTKAEVKAMNLSEFDMKALRIIERDRATSPYAKRKPKARAALEDKP